MPIKPAFDPVALRIAWELTWRTMLVGIALFVMPPTAMPPTAGQQGAAFIVLIAWCYNAGLFSRGEWFLATIEAALWFWLASKWTAILLLLFGSGTQG